MHLGAKRINAPHSHVRQKKKKTKEERIRTNEKKTQNRIHIFTHATIQWSDTFTVIRNHQNWLGAFFSLFFSSSILFLVFKFIFSAFSLLEFHMQINAYNFIRHLCVYYDGYSRERERERKRNNYLNRLVVFIIFLFWLLLMLLLLLWYVRGMVRACFLLVTHFTHLANLKHVLFRCIRTKNPSPFKYRYVLLVRQRMLLSLRFKETEERKRRERKK